MAPSSAGQQQALVPGAKTPSPSPSPSQSRSPSPFQSLSPSSASPSVVPQSSRPPRPSSLPPSSHPWRSNTPPPPPLVTTPCPPPAPPLRNVTNTAPSPGSAPETPLRRSNIAQSLFPSTSLESSEIVACSTIVGSGCDSIPAGTLSIRSQNAKDGFTAPKYRVVKSNKTSNIVNASGGKITLVWSDFHKGPHSVKNCSLLTHDIGAAVRARVPMLATTFRKLPEYHRNAVKNYLLDFYNIPETEVQLWNFIERKSRKRYSDWKHKCHKHFLKHGDAVPLEFLNRPNEWSYLVTEEFRNETKQAICKQKQLNRTKNPKPINHHAGSRPLTYTAEEYAKAGHPAPYCAATVAAYISSKHGSEMAESLKRKLEEIIQEREEVDPENKEPLPFEDQYGLVKERFGERNGTEMRGFGGQLRRPPKARGGPRSSIVEQYEERTREAEEQARQAQETSAQAMEEAKQLREEAKQSREESKQLREELNEMRMMLQKLNDAQLQRA